MSSSTSGVAAAGGVSTSPNAKKRRRDCEDDFQRSVRARHTADPRQSALRSHLKLSTTSTARSRAPPSRNLFAESAMEVEGESRIAAEEDASAEHGSPLADELADQVATEVSEEPRHLEQEIDVRVGEGSQKICQDLSDQVTDVEANLEEQTKNANATSDLRSKMEEKDKKLAEAEAQLAEYKEKAQSFENALQEANRSWSHKMAEKTTEISTLRSAVDQEHNAIKAVCVQISQQKDQSILERNQAFQEKEDALRGMYLAIQQRDETNQVNNTLRSAAVVFLMELLRKEYPQVGGFQLLTIENLSPKLLPAFEATIRFEQTLSWLGESINAFYSQNSQELEMLKSTCPSISLSSSQASSDSITSDGTAGIPETAPSQDDMMVVEPVQQLESHSMDDDSQMQEIQAIHQPQAMEDGADMQDVQTTHQSQPMDATSPMQQVQPMANRMDGVEESSSLPAAVAEETVQDDDDEEEYEPPPAVIPTDDTVNDWMGVEAQDNGDDTEMSSGNQPGNQIACSSGSACRDLLNGSCRFTHSVQEQTDAFLNQLASSYPVEPTPSNSQSLSQIPCAAGGRCKKPMGTCPYAHPDGPSQTMSTPVVTTTAVTQHRDRSSLLCKDGLTASGCQDGNCMFMHPGDHGYPLPQATVNSMRTITPSHGAGTSIVEAYSDFIDDLISAAEQSELSVPNRVVYTEAMIPHVFGLEMAIEAMGTGTLRTVSFGDGYFEGRALRLANWADPTAQAAGRDEDLDFYVSDEALATIRGLFGLDEEIRQKFEQSAPVGPVPDLSDYEDDEEDRYED